MIGIILWLNGVIVLENKLRANFKFWPAFCMSVHTVAFEKKKKKERIPLFSVGEY